MSDSASRDPDRVAAAREVASELLAKGDPGTPEDRRDALDEVLNAYDAAKDSRGGGGDPKGRRPRREPDLSF